MRFIPQAMILAACMHGSLVSMSALLDDCKGSGEHGSLSHAPSPGLLNICGPTLHHLHGSEEEGQKRVNILSERR